MGSSATLPQALFGLGTGAVTHATSANISGQGDVCCDTFSVTGGGTILTSFNNKIIARSMITIGGGAVISADGGNGTGVGTGSGGTSLPIGIFSTLGTGGSTGEAGGDGANGANNGSAGPSFSGSIRGFGGIGGFGGQSTSHNGGAPGALVNTVVSGQDKDFVTLMRGWALTQGSIYYIGGGSGGGGGAADGATGGGGGGSGGNVIYLCAPVIEIQGGIHSNGGDGSDGVAGSAGGGGGGGGGIIILIYNQLILTGSITVAGGTGGAGIGAGGTNGIAGSTGHIYHINGLSDQLGPVV